MTTHVRQQIRDAVVTAVTSLATTGANVFTSVVYPLETAALPGIIVRLAGESVQPITAPAPRRQQRTLRVEVVACAEDNADIDAALAAIALEVEAALAMPAAVGPWKALTLASLSSRLDGSTEKVRGQLVLGYDAEYYVRENAPAVAL